MGLTVLDTGLIIGVLDAGVIIGVLDARDPQHAASVRALTAVVNDGDVIAVPASAYAEALVGPARRGSAARRAVDDFLADLAAEVEPITSRCTSARTASSRPTGAGRRSRSRCSSPDSTPRHRPLPSSRQAPEAAMTTTATAAALA